jgi:flagellar basal-body rod protein FlgF
MNYGMYISASSMSAQMARQDVLSNNLANVNTTAFKPDVLSMRQRDPATREDHLSIPSNKLLERLGAGVMPMATRVDMGAAPLENTGSPLDLGIEGEGFFVVRAGNELRLTRDGRMAVSPDGILVTAAEGRPILGVNDEAISVDPAAAITIDASGRIEQNGTEVGRIALAAVSEPERLVKKGNGLFAPAPGQTLDRRPATGRMNQGMLEMSGTDPITAMISVTSASRAVESASNIIGYINELMGRAINSLGRVT